MLRRMASAMAKETEKQLRERQLLRLDSWSDDLDALFLYLAYFADALVAPVTARLPHIYAQVSKFNDQQWRLVVKAGTGINIAPPASIMTPGAVMSPFREITKRFGLGVDVYRSEPWLGELQKSWVSQNTSLIKSVPTQYMAKVEHIVRTGVLGGTTSREIAKQIKAASGVSDRRAKIIARDQIGKANGELTKHRQTDLGVEEYEWITAKDERVRGNPAGRFPRAVPSHWAREGKRFRWDKPPEGGPPGMAVLCRCFASPQFSDE
jgi:SPP1 gp7 family putative phage head morphogenesis protein